MLAACACLTCRLRRKRFTKPCRRIDSSNRMVVVGAQYAAPLGKIGKYEVPMNHRSKCFRKFLWSFFFLWVVWPVPAPAQDKIKVAYSSTDTLNQIWTITQDAGFFKKNGLDVELVYIGSTTVAISAIVAQDIQ